MYLHSESHVPANIRQGFKWWGTTNALTYYTAVLFTAFKKFFAAVPQGEKRIETTSEKR
jgi:hypothetical protein